MTERSDSINIQYSIVNIQFGSGFAGLGVCQEGGFNMKTSMLLAILLILIPGVFAVGFQNSSNNPTEKKGKGTVMSEKHKNLQTATFAGGCFWCTESDFEKIDGVIEVISGYTGGHKNNPTYKEVSAGGTGHVEAVQVLYDPEKVSYEELLDVFWRHVDPTDQGGQFVDRGLQYRSALFYHDDEQRRLAEESKKAIGKSARFEKPIVTEIMKLSQFYRAEECMTPKLVCNSSIFSLRLPEMPKAIAF